MRITLYLAPDPWSRRKYICIIVAGIYLFTLDTFIVAYHMLSTELGYVNTKMSKIDTGS